MTGDAVEEGLEPHEIIERTVEHHHHEEGHKHKASETRFLMLAAVAAAVLAVFAALGSLLSGHAANQAILNQTKASDKWAYFQSKSTKGHLYEVSKEVVASLTSAGSASGKTDEALARFQKQSDKYDREKKTIQEEAEHLEQESRDEFHKHHQFALGIAAFQVGIVLASVSIMVRYRALLLLSVLAGLAGIVFLALGLLTSSPSSPASGEEKVSAIKEL